MMRVILLRCIVPSVKCCEDKQMNATTAHQTFTQGHQIVLQKMTRESVVSITCKGKCGEYIAHSKKRECVMIDVEVRYLLIVGRPSHTNRLI